MDGDGRLDIIASNWGLNSEYEAGTMSRSGCIMVIFRIEGRWT